MEPNFDPMKNTSIHAKNPSTALASSTIPQPASAEHSFGGTLHSTHRARRKMPGAFVFIGSMALLVFVLDATRLAANETFSRTQGWKMIMEEDFLPFQLEIHRNPFYVGVEMAPRERVRINVYEIEPSGVVADARRAVYQMPTRSISGEPLWVRLRGLKVGARYAVSFSPILSSGVRVRRFFHSGGTKRILPAGRATGHPSASPSTSPYIPRQPIQPSTLGGHRIESLPYPTK